MLTITSSELMRMSGCVRCRILVKATSFSPPGISWASLYVPYLQPRGRLHVHCKHQRQASS